MIAALIAFAIAILAALALSRGLGLFLVQGESMIPTLLEGEWLVGRRWLPRETPRKGDIIILQRREFPSLLVKRILCVPGEVLPSEICASESRLPPGRYFLQSDNVRLPHCSRWIGPVEASQIQAKILLVIWPLPRLRRLR